MDSANGSYMQYNNNNTSDLNSFFNDVEQYAALDEGTSHQFDPALFAENGLASFSQQPSQPSQTAHSTFNQGQRQSQSQSPALPQYKPAQNTFSPSQYGQNMYGQPSMGQTFDPQLLSRPTPSPGPFDQFAYQHQHMNYGHPQFDYRYNSFQPQRQATAPAQAFRPQVNQQAQNFMSASRPSPQPQPHISQVQGVNGMSYSFPQAHQMQQHFIEPSLLNTDRQMHQGGSQGQQQRQMEASPYFAMADTKAGGTTLDPRALQMQQYPQLQQAQLQHTQHPKSSHVQIQPMQSQLHNFLQVQPHNSTVIASKPASKPRAKKEGKSSGSVTSSDSDLDIEEEEPEPMPAAITVPKPSDEKGKLLWEAVEAVWAPRNKPAPAEKMRSAITYVGNSIRGLRDKWKQANEQLKQAELPTQAGTRNHVQIEGLKVTVSNYRDTMQNLAANVTKYGHPSILRRLGQNQFLLSALYSFLLDRVNAEDYNSTLVASILQLGTKLGTVDEDQLEKVKWTKILVRFTKKSTNDSKTLAQQILNNAKKTTARKKAEGADAGPASPSGSSTGQVAGVKRPREGAETIQQAKKAAVKPASKPLSVQIAEQRKLKEKERDKDRSLATKDGKQDKATSGSTNGATVPARPKVSTALPQKSSPFASLMSASKKPGTTNAERAAKEKVDVPKPPSVPNQKESVAKVEAPSAKPLATATSASSFLGFLADMDKPKEAPKTKVEEDPNETAEARAKRLRKESRRRLRVSWKPEGELVQTRIFEHDPDEETGHEDSMMRDVGDTGKEGEMLKHRLNVDDLDEDSDDEMEFFMPTEVDFSIMKTESEDPQELNFVKCGGKLVPESPVSTAQAEHEEGNMMTVYAAGEQPNTPKEPSEGDDDDFSPVADFGEPVDGRVRRREQSVLSRRQAYAQPAQPQTQGFDLASALSSLYPQQQNAQSQQPDWIRALGLSNQQPQQAQPQQSTLQGLDLSQLLAAAAAQTQPQQASYQPPAVPPQSAPATSSLTPNILGLLSQLQQSGTGLPMGANDNPNPYPGGAIPSKDNKRDKKDKKKGKGGAPLGPDGLPVNYKTKVCQFWLDGVCSKGDACTYRHDREGLDAS